MEDEAEAGTEQHLAALWDVRGGATEVAVVSVGSVDIMEAGGWVSDAVDAYIWSQGKSKGVSRALVRCVNF